MLRKTSEELPLIPQWMLNKSPGAMDAGGSRPLPSPGVGPSPSERPWVTDRWGSAQDKDIAEGTKGTDKWGQDERRWKEDERGDSRLTGGVRRDVGGRWNKPSAFENGWAGGETPNREGGFASDRWSSSMDNTPPSRDPPAKDRWRDDRWGAPKPIPEQRTWSTGAEGLDARGEPRAVSEARGSAADTPSMRPVEHRDPGRWRSPGEGRGDESMAGPGLGKHRGFGFGRGRGHGFAPGGGGDAWERAGGGDAPGASAFPGFRHGAAPSRRSGQQYTIAHLKDIQEMMQFKLRADLPLPRGLRAIELGPLMKGAPDEDDHEHEELQSAAAQAASNAGAAATAAPAAATPGASAAQPSTAVGGAPLPFGAASTAMPAEQQAQQAASLLSLGSNAAAVFPQDLAPALQQLSGLGLGQPAQQQQPAQVQAQQPQPQLAPQQQQQAGAPLQLPDAWVYQDPQGNVQGPFTKADIMEWLEAGYFTLNLPIKPASEAADRGWVPLHVMLQAWQSHHPAPPGFATSVMQQPQLGGMPSMHSQPSAAMSDALMPGIDLAAQQQQQQQQQLASAASLGSAPSLGLGPHGMPHSLLGDPLALLHHQQQQQQMQLGGLGGMGQAPQQLMQQHQMHAGAQAGGLGQGMGQPFGTTMGMPASQHGPHHAPWGAVPQQMMQPTRLPAHAMQQLQPGTSAFSAASFDGQGMGQQQQQPPFSQAPSLLQQQHMAQQQAQMAAQHAAQQQQADLQRQVQQQAQQQAQQQVPQQPQPQQAGNVLDLIFPNHAQQQQHQQQPAPQPATQVSPWVKAPEPAAAAAAPQDEATARPRLFARGQQQQQQQQQQAAPAPAAAQKQVQEPAADDNGWEVVSARPHKPAHASELMAPPSQQPQQQRKAPAGTEQPPPAADSSSVPSGPITVPLLPQRPAEPPKVAPWAASTQAPPAGKTLREIQEEEQARAAAEAARQKAAAEAAAAAAPAAAPVGPWGRTASGAIAAPPGQWGAAPPAAASSGAAAVPMREILNEEQQRAAQAPPRTASLEARPSGKKATLGDVIAAKLEGPGPGAAAAAPIAWAAGGNRTVMSLKQVMLEETVADLEGGAVEEEGLEELLFPLQQRNAAAAAREREAQQQQQQQQREAQAAAAAELRAKVERERRAIAEQSAPHHAREDEGLFWDYGGPSGAPQQQPVRAPAPAPRAAPAAANGGWASRVAASAGAASAAAPRAAQPSAPTQQRAAAAPARPAYAAAAAPAPVAAPAAAAPVPRGGSGLFMGALELSLEFATWCRAQMMHFNGNDDLTLVEFLWGIDSNSEVAEYCQELWGNRPGVSSFVADFIKRKAAEIKGSSSRRKKKASAAAVAATTAAAPSTGISSAAVGLVGAGPGTDTWNKIPKKPAAKKKGGKKVDPSELGFTSKLPIALLEADE